MQNLLKSFRENSTFEDRFFVGGLPLDVTFSFGGAILNWRSPDALGIVEQSVLLGLLSAGGQQRRKISLTNSSPIGSPLISRLELNEHSRTGDLILIQLSWNSIVAAAGYRHRGGPYVKLVRAALKRLAETTIWEKKNGKEYQSKVLAWLEGDKSGVTIALNRRASSLSEFLCAEGHEMIPKGKHHDHTNEHNNQAQETESPQALSG